jgi:LuxR family maltose regulon positive regulatory protein
LINQQPEETQNFLLRTSMLEEFDSRRCEQVIGQALSLPSVDWQVLMQDVQQRNLFVLPVGEDGSWLRYHYLFLDFLQNRMHQQKPDEASAIENRLAILYLNLKDWDNAFAIFRRLNLVEELAGLIEQAGPEMLVTGRLSGLSAWLDSLPARILSERPNIVSLQGAIAAMMGDTRLALSLYDQAIGAMKLPGDRMAMVRALSWRAGTYRMIGELNASITDAQAALSLGRMDPSMSRITAEALRCIGLCLHKQGKLNEALTWLNQALATALSTEDGENSAIIRLGIGLVNENLGDYTQARAMYTLAMDHWQRTENGLWLSNLLNNLGVLQHLSGDYTEAIVSFEKALQYARENQYPRIEAFVLAGIGDIYGELEAHEEALKAYKQARLIAQRHQINFLQVYLNVQEAVLVSLNGDISGGYRLIEMARTDAARDDSTLELYLCDLEYAGIKIREEKPSEVIAILEKACQFFEIESHKVQREKAHLYLALAYGQTGDHEILVKHVLKVLSYLNVDYKPASLIAMAYRHYDQLEKLRHLDYIEGQLDDLFEKVGEFRNDLLELRRFLRQNTTAVPFAPPKVTIRALGKMQVIVNQRLVTSSDWQTQAARDLFFMLLAHPEGKNKDEIGVIFWPDAAPKDVRLRLKNTVYRLRHAVGKSVKSVVLLDQDNYRFNNGLDYEYDVELFLKENALGLKAREPLQQLSHFREAIKLYKGIFLPGIEETWVHSPRESLQQIFINILIEVAELYLQMANYDLALEYGQRALEVDNCLEAAYRISFRIFAGMGDRASVVRQYKRCVEVLRREFNTEPSPQTRELYETLLK